MSSDNKTAKVTPVKTSEPLKTEKPVLRICCACPETKAPRDECVMRNGEEACQSEIEAHKECLRSYGFKVCHIYVYMFNLLFDMFLYLYIIRSN